MKNKKMTREEGSKCIYCGRDTGSDAGFHDCKENPSGFCIPKWIT